MIRRSSTKLTLLSAAVAITLLVLLNEAITTAHHPATVNTNGNSGADGAAVYGSKCALCHGKDGAGLPNWRSKGQPDFTKAEWQDSHTDTEITDSIKNGKGKHMPAFKSKLSEEEIAAVVQRVRAFGKASK